MGMQMNWKHKDDPAWPFGRLKKVPRRSRVPTDLPPAPF
jgi:hypothetical protein